MERRERREKDHPGNGIKIPKVGRICQTVHILKFERFKGQSQPLKGPTLQEAGKQEPLSAC
jgi:hypothetical protein